MALPYRIPVVPVEDPLLPSTFRNSASDERGYQRIRVRQDTFDNWLKNDPILASGEFAFVIGATNPGETLKIGDGTLRWSQLPWLMATGNSGPAGPAGPPGPGPTVYEQATAPLGAIKDGDIWLQPFTTKDGSDPATIEDVQTEIANILEQIKAGMVIEAGGFTLEDVKAEIARALSATDYATEPWVQDHLSGLAKEGWVQELVDAVPRLAPVAAGTSVDVSPLEARIVALESMFDPRTAAGAAYVRQLKTLIQSVVVGDPVPPADIDWTRVLNPGNAPNHNIDVRLKNGRIELRGMTNYSSGGYAPRFLALPANFPTPELTASYPVACRQVGSAVRTGYLSVTIGSREVSASFDGLVNETTVGGVSWRAAY